MRSKRFCLSAKTIFSVFITFLLTSAIVPAQARKEVQGATRVSWAEWLWTWRSSGQRCRGKPFGTTEGGGTGKCTSSGCGTVFKLDKNGKQVWLYSFQGSNGLISDAGLLRDAAGSLFGTTVEGGKSTKVCGDIQAGGCGVVFKLDKMGKEAVLHKFTGNPDGYFPEALLVEDSAGNLYGTTVAGGVHGSGTVFKIDKTGKETVLHNFAGKPDGALPIPE